MKSGFRPLGRNLSFSGLTPLTVLRFPDRGFLYTPYVRPIGRLRGNVPVLWLYAPQPRQTMAFRYFTTASFGIAASISNPRSYGPPTSVPQRYCSRCSHSRCMASLRIYISATSLMGQHIDQVFVGLQLRHSSLCVGEDKCRGGGRGTNVSQLIKAWQ